ncbi:phosphoribosylaminoimidazolesuccinocarboxamide synthase [Proteiniclasticum sp. SCR006]|uniref:Phosphoribosylaminoimidazole-succinocarboxamide synthase n=1 Tax=Proteiniclasticum aestuarii TaxID=2817862 RepID=A0A939HC98_9CLOT|nr:phosphoribosylaminoimidazolesuccinocarboxamide synthase [Proteiniclasticum aestuarii]MBO1265803.1 phosphoribosylaminoimidazolesuccinocarboxamide synthase [Proteiniclasticum aestuarii]
MNMLYEGKAKRIFETEKEDQVIVYYKDDATAFNGEKKGTIEDKGIMNNEITSIIFRYLADHGIPTHYIRTISEREQLVKRVSIIPLEVIVRNVAAGSFSKRLGVPEGQSLQTTIFEICYKNDDYGDPLINDTHAVALGLSTFDELKEIYALTEKINHLLKDFFLKLGLILVDFKLEFGKDKDGNILLADEISPDTCRLWDEKTNEKMDKDRFRRNLDNVKGAYSEVISRMKQGES